MTIVCDNSVTTKRGKKEGRRRRRRSRRRRRRRSRRKRRKGKKRYLVFSSRPTTETHRPPWHACHPPRSETERTSSSLIGRIQCATMSWHRVVTNCEKLLRQRVIGRSRHVLVFQKRQFRLARGLLAVVVAAAGPCPPAPGCV